jgi:hypothetical protein
MHTIATKLDNKAHILFWGCVSLLFFLAVVYGYLVNVTIFNVANRAKVETQITQLNSRLGELEFEYLSLKSGVTLEKAYALGFKEVESTHFIALDDASKGLSYYNR